MPGVKCYICEAILDDDAARHEHLTVDHKIMKNHHLLSFGLRRMHREMELLDMVSDVKDTGIGLYCRHLNRRIIGNCCSGFSNISQFPEQILMEHIGFNCR